MGKGISQFISVLFCLLYLCFSSVKQRF